MATQSQINEIARQGGLAIIKAGIAMLQSAFDLNPFEVSKEDLPVLWAKYKVGPIIFDNTFYVIDWDTWKLLIKYDWIKEMKYLKERRDCDNFSFAFASRMSELYGINSAGVAVGQLCKNGKCEQVGSGRKDRTIKY